MDVAALRDLAGGRERILWGTHSGAAGFPSICCSRAVREWLRPQPDIGVVVECMFYYRHMKLAVWARAGGLRGRTAYRHRDRLAAYDVEYSEAASSAQGKAG
jgi:hypothetical protein